MNYPCRAELAALIPAVRITALLGPHYIASDDNKCPHFEDECECILEFDCPLCQVDSTATLAAMEEHYNTVHWSQRVEVGKYTLFPCGLLHAASSRISCMQRATLHYHCPVCISSTFTSVETLRTHCSVMHGSRGWEEPQLELLPDRFVSLPFGERGHSRVSFNEYATLRQYPLALSIAEQAGGRNEPKPSPVSFASFVSLGEITELASARSPFHGCNGANRLRLFQGFCFLICGIDVPPSTIAAIYSLGGSISGAGYQDSEEWKRITHVLLGNRIGPKSIKNLRKQIPPNLVSLLWVSSEWVRNSVEKGTLFREDCRFFMPAALERFFAVRDANARADRRKSRVRSPNITVVNLSNETPGPRMSPPVISCEGSLMCTPGPSPVISHVFAPPDAIFPPKPPNAIYPPKPPDTAGLRRSKRLSMAPTPARFHGQAPTAPARLGVHSPIHKPH